MNEIEIERTIKEKEMRKKLIFKHWLWNLGSLLEQAESLIEKGVHPIRIAQGYDMACKMAVEHLKTIADQYQWSAENPEALISTAMTSLGSKM